MNCKITTLADSIIKTDKMSATEVIDFIGSAMENGDSTEQVYKSLYQKIYGKTFTRELADSWVKCMAVTDGSDRASGIKWSFDNAVEVGNKLSVDWHLINRNEWYAVLNMMYSDYYNTAKYADKQTDPLFYAHLTKEWLCDEDVSESKTFDYYFNVVCQ